MRSPRLTLAVTTLATALALTACSGSDDDKKADSPSAAASETSKAPEPYQRKCAVEVELTGAVEASWSGKGRSSNEAGPTMYTYAQGKNQVIVYAGKDDIPTNANVTVKGKTYTTTDPDQGFDVAGNGTKASVDADTTGVKGPGPHLKATFDCGKQKKGKSKS